MLAVDDLALPSAVRRRVRADGIEERVAAPDVAIVQHVSVAPHSQNRSQPADP
jgi:hypothetical protein